MQSAVMTAETTDDARRVHEFAQRVHDASAETIPELLSEYYHDDATFHGPAPLGELVGPDDIAAGYWEPLLASFPDLERNDYALFGGEFDGDRWVAATGNLVGTFEADWLDVPATGHATWLRYGEFHRMEDGRIAETRSFLDVLDLLRQAGYEFVPALAPEVVIPGPSTQDGVLPADGGSATTLELVEDMIFEGLESFEEVGLDGMGLDEYWHEDFMWYGPAGIGTTRGIDGFQEFHQGPFLEVFPDRLSGGDDVRIAQGDYCAWHGWPSLEATHTGDGWLGLPATGESVTMRVMDVWRREGDLLAENWVFIDMIDLLDQLGVDVFERLRTNPESVRTRLP
jgi:predicted ester cyclase